MEQENIVLDQERQKQASAYRRAQGRVSILIWAVFGILFGLGLSLLRFAILLLPSQRQIIILNLEPIPGWFPLIIFVDMALLLVFILLFLLPLSWYIDLVLPRRYGLSERTSGAWLKSFAKGTLIRMSQFLLFTECVFFFYTLQPQFWWFWTSVIYALYLFAHERWWVTYILPHFHPVKPLDMSGELTLQLIALMKSLNYFVSGIFVIHFDVKVANAYYVGWGKGRYVLLTNTLLQTFTNDEIEVILAHELGHMVHHDIWKRVVLHSLLVMVFLGMLSMMLSIFINSSALADQDRILRDVLSILLMLGVGLIGSFYMALLRRQEYQADEFALQATGKVQAFKNAMTRLINVNMVDANYQKKNKNRGTHPSLHERLLHADEFASRRRKVSP